MLRGVTSSSIVGEGRAAVGTELLPQLMNSWHDANCPKSGDLTLEMHVFIAPFRKKKKKEARLSEL